MRVVATSDLHYSTHYAAAVEAFAAKVVARSPDVLIVAGDIGEGLARFRACLELFAALPKGTLRCAIAGNHDVWTYPGEPASSRDRLERVLPALARDAGFQWLETDCPAIGRTAFAGSLGWYDWSGVHPAARATDEHILEVKRRSFVDAWRVDWPDHDREVAARLGAALEERLERLERDPAIERVVLATHIPPWTGGLPSKKEYAITAAFFLNLTLGRRLLRFRKITHAVAGHIHRDAGQRIPREGAPPIDFRIIPSDYGKPRAVELEVEG